MSALVQRGHLHNNHSSESGVVFERVLLILRGVAAGMACMHSQNIGERSASPERALCLGCMFAAFYGISGTSDVFHSCICPLHAVCTIQLTGRGLTSHAQHPALSLIRAHRNRPQPSSVTAYTSRELRMRVGAVHGDLRPGNVLLQVPVSERLEEPHSWPDADHAALCAASALDSEQCTAKISSFALGSLLEIPGATREGVHRLAQQRLPCTTAWPNSLHQHCTSTLHISLHPRCSCCVVGWLARRSTSCSMSCLHLHEPDSCGTYACEQETICNPENSEVCRACGGRGWLCCRVQLLHCT